MRSIIALLTLLCGFNVSIAQTVVFDQRHFEQVTENQIVRSAAEAGHQNNLNSIRNSINNINANMTSVVLIQDVMYRSLTEVNEALKDGLMFKNMTGYVSDIISNCNRMLVEAQGEPYLLLFAESQLQWSRARVTDMVLEMNDFILKEGMEAMMDYSKRDYLLDNINVELVLLRASTYRALRSMHYAKMNGLLKSLNPYQDFINRDRSLVNEIIRNTNYLKK